MPNITRREYYKGVIVLVYRLTTIILNKNRSIKAYGYIHGVGFNRYGNMYHSISAGLSPIKVKVPAFVIKRLEKEKKDE